MMDSGRIKDLELTHEEKKLFFDTCVDDANTLLQFFDALEWSHTRALNSINFGLALMMKAGYMDEEDLRIMFAGVMNNYKLMED